MATQDTIRSLVDAFNRHDAKAFAACYSAKAEVGDPQYAEPLKGTEAVARDIGAWFGAMPDVKAKLTNTLTDGSAYAVEWTMSGTHKGPMVTPTGNVPPTGRTFNMTAATVGRVDDKGQIVEEHRYYDLAGVMGQLGLIE